MAVRVSEGRARLAPVAGTRAAAAVLPQDSGRAASDPAERRRMEAELTVLVGQLIRRH
jgi:hypothetical protein